MRNYGSRAADVLALAEPDSIKGSRSGLYKHYPRLYEGAAATTGYPYLEAEVLYAMKHEYAVTPADILARRTRLAFLNSTAARLTLPRVVEIMGNHFGWSEARRAAEYKRAEEMLDMDFAGPAPNKQGAKLRTACAADVKDAFDSLDASRLGFLKREGIDAAAKKLGFPLDKDELDEAMGDMDIHGNGEVSFPEFLVWWNSCEKGNKIREHILKSETKG